MKRIFVCSRYAGDIEKNVARTKELCRIVLRLGHAPFAPHLIYPLVLDEALPGDRILGITAGLRFLAICDEMWVDCASLREASSGMVREIEFFTDLGGEQQSRSRVIYSPKEWATSTSIEDAVRAKLVE